MELKLIVDIVEGWSPLEGSIESISLSNHLYKNLEALVETALILFKTPPPFVFLFFFFFGLHPGIRTRDQLALIPSSISLANHSYQNLKPLVEAAKILLNIPFEWSPLLNAPPQLDPIRRTFGDTFFFQR